MATFSRFCQSFVLILFILVSTTFAQKIDVENTYDISGKARRGELVKVEHLDNKDYTLHYQLRSSNRKVKTETYTFDNDFRFKSFKESEEDIEKTKEKYSWFDYVADDQLFNLIRVETTIKGQIVLNFGQLTYKNDWKTGSNYWDWYSKDKIQLKDKDGRQQSLISYYSDEPNLEIISKGWNWLNTTNTTLEATGNLTLFCNIVTTKKDLKNGIKESEEPFSMIEYSALTKEIIEEKSFGKEELGDRYQDLIYQQHLKNGNFAMIYAAAKHSKKENQKLRPTDFHYLEVSFKEKRIVKSIAFKSGNSYWNINNIETIGDDIYLHGAGKDTKNDKFYTKLAKHNNGKYTNYQIIKFTKDKIAWSSKTTLDEFTANLITPPSQKKNPKFKGKNFLLEQFIVTKSGDIFINGQNYRDSKRGYRYKDLFVFHFGNKGKLKAQYGIEMSENSKFTTYWRTECLFKETQDGKRMSWIIMEIEGFKDSQERLLKYGRVANIDIEKGGIQDFLNLGQEGKEKYYLYTDFPILPSTESDQMSFFGADKSGKTIWFSRVLF